MRWKGNGRLHETLRNWRWNWKGIQVLWIWMKDVMEWMNMKWHKIWQGSEDLMDRFSRSYGYRMQWYHRYMDMKWKWWKVIGVWYDAMIILKRLSWLHGHKIKWHENEDEIETILKAMIWILNEMIN